MENVPVSKKNKSYEIDGDVADAFGDYCQARGVLIGRAVEAVFVHAMSLDAAQLGQLFLATEEWKATHRGEEIGPRLDREVGPVADQQTADAEESAKTRRRKKGGPPGA